MHWVRDAGAAEVDVAVEYERRGRPLVFVGARRTSELASKPEDFEAAVVQVAALDTSDPAVALAALEGGEPIEQQVREQVSTLEDPAQDVIRREDQSSEIRCCQALRYGQ